jgi:hypothetical protein
MNIPPLPSRAALEGALDTRFDLAPLEGASASVELRLVEVAVRKSRPGHEQLSLLFAGPASPVAQQGSYRFTHATLGELVLFISPVGPASTQMQYEACISRPLEA